MQLGWIDFSRSERDKVVNLLSLLEEGGILDELGIAPIRDAFSDVFFPGTSTIQTVPKYFFIVAYILKDFEKGNETNKEKALQAIRDAEKAVCEKFGNNDGVIGRRALDKTGWLKRTPADIYWAGMRRYGIITGGRMSMGEYVRSICNLRKVKNMGIPAGKRERDGDNEETDDIDAGREYGMMHVNMPIYKKGWMKDENLSIKLTREEGEFLKAQIIANCPDTMLAYVLENNIKEFYEAEDFEALKKIAEKYNFPDEMRRKIDQAIKFSEFVYITRIVYNMVVCPDWEGDEEFKRYEERVKQIAEEFDIDTVMSELGVSAPILRSFLKEAKESMLAEDVEGLKNAVTKREMKLKTSRARCAHPGEYEYKWYGGGRLDYRFSTAKRIVRDIFESEV